MDRLNRRHFIKAASGLFIPALFDILIPRCRAQVIPSGPIMRTIAAGGGGSCTTVKDQVTGTTAATTTDGYQWIFSRFTAASSYTTCKVRMRLMKTGTPSGNMTMKVYSHNAGANSPNAILGTSQNFVSADVPASPTPGDVTKDFLTPFSIASGTIYWVGVNQPSGGGFPGTNFLTTYTGAVGSGRLMVSESNGTTWIEADTGTGLNFTLYE